MFSNSMARNNKVWAEVGTVIWVCHYGTYSKLSRPDFCWLGDLKWALSSGYVTMVRIVNFQDLTSAGWEI